MPGFADEELNRIAESDAALSLRLAPARRAFQKYRADGMRTEHRQVKPVSCHGRKFAARFSAPSMAHPTPACEPRPDAQ